MECVKYGLFYYFKVSSFEKKGKSTPACFDNEVWAKEISFAAKLQSLTTCSHCKQIKLFLSAEIPLWKGPKTTLGEEKRNIYISFYSSFENQSSLFQRDADSVSSHFWAL